MNYHIHEIIKKQTPFPLFDYKSPSYESLRTKKENERITHTKQGPILNLTFTSTCNPCHLLTQESQIRFSTHKGEHSEVFVFKEMVP